MAKRHSKEHSRRKRISRSNGIEGEKTRTGGRESRDQVANSKGGFGNAKHLKHSQADLTRAYQVWRRTSDPRVDSIKFQEFSAQRPDENQDYIPQRWAGYLGKMSEREAQHKLAEERERLIQEVLNDHDKVAQAIATDEQDQQAKVKKMRKPRTKKADLTLVQDKAHQIEINTLEGWDSIIRGS